MKHYLLKEIHNCGDEFTTYGFSILNEQEVSDLICLRNKMEQAAMNDEDLTSEFYSKQFSFGTNESITINLFDYFYFKELTEESYNVLNSLFGNSYGNTFLYKVTSFLNDTQIPEYKHNDLCMNCEEGVCDSSDCPICQQQTP